MTKAAMAHPPGHVWRRAGGLFIPAGARVLGLSVVLVSLLSACGGGGGGDDGGGPSPPTPFNGRITYDKVPFRTAPGNPLGLNYDAIIEAPVRGAVVEAINATDRTTILATTTTDANGNYSMTLPQGTSFFVRTKAQLLRTGTPAWNFRVLNNTNNNALYALDSPNFTNNGSQRNVRATSGWTGAGYGNARNAAPFSILDVAYEVLTLVQTADPNAVLPQLNIHWAPQNKASDGPPDFAIGNIGTTHFRDTQPREIYILGDQNMDTDEFDQHVIAHELGHYFQSVFSRDDSIGGPHSSVDRLDLRVAFSEGWGNAFSGMVKNDPRYRDSFGPQQATDFDINVENDTQQGEAGWYRELSAALVIYDLFDATADGADTVSLGFTPVFQAMNALQNVDVFTSLFSFVPAVKSGQDAGTVTAINTLVAAQNMNSATMDELGSTETNNGGEAANLPIYRAAAVDGVVRQVCTSTANGDDHNKLGSRRYLRFEIVGAPRTVNIRAEAVGFDPDNPADPDFHVWREGLIFEGIDDSRADGIEEKMTPVLQPGFHVLEVYDFQGVDSDPTTAPACVNVTLS